MINTDFISRNNLLCLNNKIVQVENITPNFVGLKDLGYVEASELEPIEINHENLIKAGFKRNDNEEVKIWEKGKFRLVFVPEGDSEFETGYYFDYNDEGDIVLHHFHDLQNIYKILAKEELI